MTDDIQKNKELKNQVWLLCVDRFLDSIDTVIAKITSGSFIATLALVVTYCWMGKHLISSIPVEKITSDFVFGFIAGFSSSVMFVLKAYFDRGDKKQVQKGDRTDEKVISSSSNGVSIGNSGTSGGT